MVGVPVTINGDLKNQFVEANVGFDTICKVTEIYFIPLASPFRLITFFISLSSLMLFYRVQVNSQLISNVCTDALSAEKVNDIQDVVND